MALRLTGSNRDAVELVRVETDEFTLIIKGKPYHERYEGLKQYRTFHQDEVMRLLVKGTGNTSVLVFDVEEDMLVEQHPALRPIFFENGVYQVVITPRMDRELTFYHEHPQLRQAVDIVGEHGLMMGALHFQNEVGLSTFEIRDRDETLLEVTMEIFPTKLDYKKDYEQLIREVNDEVYNLAFHLIKKTYLGAVTKVEGDPSLTEYYRILQQQFRSLLQAIERIEKQPHHQLRTDYEKVRGDRLRRVDAVGRDYLRKRPHLFVEVAHGIPVLGKSLMPQSGMGVKKQLTTDTHENRLVKMMMTRTLDKMDDLQSKLTRPSQWPPSEPDKEFVQTIESMKGELQKRLRRSFWRQIGTLDRSVMSLVMQMAPGYRDAFQIYIMLSRGLTLRGSLYRMSVKDVATLYEYWTYLKLGQLLRQKYELVSQDVVKVNTDHVFVQLDGSRSAKNVFRHPHTGEKIVLEYQYASGKLPTLSQQPDTMLSIEKKGKDHTYNYIFDAKYRIDFALEGSYYGSRYKSPGPMEDDINTMHRYRDALVVQHDGPYERSAFGAYVLFPWFEEEIYKDHDFYKSIDSVNIGGLPFLPGATKLVEQFVERLIEKSPEEIQREGILPRGTWEEWLSAFDEKVLVGVVKSSEHAKAHQAHRFYHIPLSRLKSGWQEAKYVALYYTQKVSESLNGVHFYGEITGFEIRRRGEITEIASKPSSLDELYVVFRVKSWKVLERVIRPVQYGIQVYTMTTLQTLKAAKELPELFMKSEEEVTLWRLMRRFSSQVVMDLDDTHLDKAERILSYRIKGNVELKLEVDHEGEELLITSSSSGDEVVPISMLRTNPSGVFRVLVELMG